MFKRKVYNSLLEWKETSNGSTALLIEGARRIGKSTIAELFGANEFPAYKLIDFSIYGNEFKDIFAKLSNIDDFFSELPKGLKFIYKKVIILDFKEEPPFEFFITLLDKEKIKSY